MRLMNNSVMSLIYSMITKGTTSVVLFVKEMSSKPNSMFKLLLSKLRLIELKRRKPLLNKPDLLKKQRKKPRKLQQRKQKQKEKLKKRQQDWLLKMRPRELLPRKPPLKSKDLKMLWLMLIQLVQRIFRLENNTLIRLLQRLRLV